jgi:hypothetical protein
MSYSSLIQTVPREIRFQFLELITIQSFGWHDVGGGKWDSGSVVADGG